MNPLRSPFDSVRKGACAFLLIALTACGGGLDPILGTPAVARVPSVTATTPIAATPAVTGVDVNTRVTATFSKPMLASSINATSFTLACPAAAPVAATVAYNATTQVATLTPTNALPQSTTCVATIAAAVQDTTGIALGSAFVWSFVTGVVTPVDTTRPTVTLTVPAAGAAAVATNTGISATFSEPMNAATISATSFTVANTTLGSAVTGTVAYDAASRTATFTPTTPALLPAGSLFTATVSAAVTDVAGNTLAGNTAVPPGAGSHVWTFTTGVVADTTRPTVTLTVPAAGALGVATNTRISATFSEAMNAATVSATSFTLVNTTLGTAVTGTVAYDAASRTATFTPTIPALLPTANLFTATIAASATDVAGNGLAGNAAVPPAAGAHLWTFTTGAAGDTTAPTVSAVSPPNLATSICLTRPVTATFSEPMDAATVNATTFTVADGAVLVPGSVSYNAANQVATFTPTAPAGFTASRTFTVTVASGATGVKDLAGNALAVNSVTTFSTGTTACLAPVNLGTAATFGAFGGGAGVTNQGINTIIGGNVGTTAACTLITGLHDANAVYTESPLNIGGVSGTIQCGPPAPGTVASLAVATQARSDAQTAYTALAAIPGGNDPGAGQLGGLVLAPGVYKSAGGTFAITNGNLTLDAQGDPNAVWVFQTAAGLTVGLTATPRTVLLENGAQAKNVFWQVGSAARIEDGSTMVGTIIAPAGVTISTAGQTIQTRLTGRAIGLTAVVTMVNTTIVAP